MTKSEKKRVLIIEDDPAEQYALKKLVTETGYEALTAADGENGLKMINNRKPDLVLLDIILPKINGFDILELTKKSPETKQIPIIVLTNLNDDETRIKSETLGAVGHLVKMETYPHEIVRKIDQFIGQKRST